MLRVNAIRPSAAAAALLVSMIGLGMSAVSALDRGATGADQALIVAASMAVTAGAHVLPAITRSAAGRAVWAACLLVALYGHAGFVAGSQQRAGEQRAAAVQPTEHQRMLREQLAGLPTQSPADAAAALAKARSVSAASGAALARCESTTPGRCATPRAAAAAAAARADAAGEALAQARQAADLRADMTRAAAGADARRDVARTDPAALALASLTGLPATPIQLGMSLLTAMLIELLGALLWRRAITTTMDQHHADDITTAALRHPHPALARCTYPSSDPRHRRADDAGRVPPDPAGPRHADRVRDAGVGNDDLARRAAHRRDTGGADRRQVQGAPDAPGHHGHGARRVRPVVLDPG